MKNGGLVVRGGRLINERTEDCMAPITRAGIMRREMKRMKKVEMIADGVALGEMRSESKE
jgi:hypothetical protein